MDVLNIAFGMIGVGSFIYAIWQNRTAENAKKLTRRVTQNIRELANEITRMSRGTTIEGYARSIVQISSSLLPDTQSPRDESLASPKPGQVQIDYVAPQLSSNMSALKVRKDAPFGCFYSAELSEENPLKQGEVPRLAVLAYGPYKTLPSAGRYRADFKIRRGRVQETPNSSLVRIDVYCHRDREFYGVRYLSVEQILESWQIFSVDFDYPNSEVPLEYRTIVVAPHVEIVFSHVTITLLGE